MSTSAISTDVPASADEPQSGFYEQEADHEKGLFQADLLLDYPLVFLEVAGAGEDPQPVRRTGAVVVLTQTCDIPKKSQPTILLALARPFKVALSENRSLFGDPTMITALRQNTSVAFLLFPPSSSSDWMIVDLRRTYTVPKQSIADYLAAGNAPIRLLSPYREHVAQMYARFLMRVGLPTTFDSFATYSAEAIAAFDESKKTKKPTVPPSE